MNALHLLSAWLVMCGVACSLRAQTITATPTNGPTTITIRARTTDGRIPENVSCEFGISPGQIGWPPPPQILPPLGTNGDWMVTNVRPDYYYIAVRGPDFADYVQEVLVKQGASYLVNIVLSRGATFRGRVVEDTTSKPIAGVTLHSEHYDYPLVQTSREGSFEFSHIAADMQFEVCKSNFVAQIIHVNATTENSITHIPDIRLQRGGWISGHVERPKEMADKIYASVSLEFQGSLPTNVRVEKVYPTTNGTFRTRNLPPGTYTLQAEWSARGGKSERSSLKKQATRNWKAEGSTNGIQVVVGQETTNVIIQTKTVILPNSNH